MPSESVEKIRGSIRLGEPVAGIEFGVFGEKLLELASV